MFAISCQKKAELLKKRHRPVLLAPFEKSKACVPPPPLKLQFPAHFARKAVPLLGSCPLALFVFYLRRNFDCKIFTSQVAAAPAHYARKVYKPKRVSFSLTLRSLRMFALC
jgi:hypothetical protein